MVFSNSPSRKMPGALACRAVWFALSMAGVFLGSLAMDWASGLRIFPGQFSIPLFARSAPLIVLLATLAQWVFLRQLCGSWGWVPVLGALLVVLPPREQVL